MGSIRKLEKNLNNSWKLMRMKTHNLWDTTKAILRGKHIATQASFKKLEKAPVQKQTVHLKDLEKEQQIKPKPSRRKELINIRAEINEIETRFYLLI